MKILPKYFISYTIKLYIQTYIYTQLERELLYMINNSIALKFFHLLPVGKTNPAQIFPFLHPEIK